MCRPNTFMILLLYQPLHLKLLHIYASLTFDISDMIEYTTAFHGEYGIVLSEYVISKMIKEHNKNISINRKVNQRS